MKNMIKVYYWNPNGTNDIQIGDDCLQEALFGLDISRFKDYSDDTEYALIPLKIVLKYIAVSPVSDGSETINFLKKHFDF